MKIPRYATLVIIFLLGIAVGSYGHKIAKTLRRDSHLYHSKRLLSAPGDTHLIKPLLLCERPQDSTLKFASLRLAINSYINTNVGSGNITRVSVYYKDLNTGDWFGINDGDHYDAASLLKVPLLIVYLKEAERDLSVLRLKINCASVVKEVPQEPASQHGAQSEDVHSIKHLLRRMIVYSDNIASACLLANAHLESLAKLFSALELPFLEHGQTDFKMSAKDFSVFFRILYNATYLNTDMSEKALELLAETDFQDGLVAGVPNTVTVAHKFGKRVLSAGGEELHDCGIVYSPKGPYVFCVMTEGRDFHTLQNVIKEISKMAYENM